MFSLRAAVAQIPEGFSKARAFGKTYSINKTTFNNGKSVKVYADELGGTDFISFNWYLTTAGESFKPCEMPEAKVLAFLQTYEPLDKT